MLDNNNELETLPLVTLFASLPDSEVLVEEIKTKIAAGEWQLVKTPEEPSSFKFVRYECRARPTRSGNNTVWAKRGTCTEEEYNRYKANPNANDWEYQVRELYEKVKVATNEFINCKFS